MRPVRTEFCHLFANYRKSTPPCRPAKSPRHVTQVVGRRPVACRKSPAAQTPRSSQAPPCHRTCRTAVLRSLDQEPEDALLVLRLGRGCVPQAREVLGERRHPGSLLRRDHDRFLALEVSKLCPDLLEPHKGVVPALLERRGHEAIRRVEKREPFARGAAQGHVLGVGAVVRQELLVPLELRPADVAIVVIRTSQASSGTQRVRVRTPPSGEISLALRERPKTYVPAYEGFLRMPSTRLWFSRPQMNPTACSASSPWPR